MKFNIRLGLLVAILGLLAAQARAQNLGPPTAPSGGLNLLDLNGQTSVISTLDTDSGQCLPCVVQNYNPTNESSLSFTVPNDVAGLTTLTFAFRNDSGYFGFSNVMLTAHGGGSNLISNGDFSLPPVGGSLSGITDATDLACAVSTSANTWCNFNQAAGFAGRLSSNPDGTQVDGSGSGLVWPGDPGPAQFWIDGATQEYDGLYQNVMLTPGQTYDLSFDLIDLLVNEPGGAYNGCADAGYTSYHRTSTNGDTTDICGNGVNATIFAGFPGLPTPQQPGGPVGAPEPATLALLGTGLFGIGALRRRRRAA